jgi:hypothetical protein
VAQTLVRKAGTLAAASYDGQDVDDPDPEMDDEH